MCFTLKKIRHKAFYFQTLPILPSTFKNHPILGLYFNFLFYNIIETSQFLLIYAFYLEKNFQLKNPTLKTCILHEKLIDPLLLQGAYWIRLLKKLILSRRVFETTMALVVLKVSFMSFS